MALDAAARSLAARGSAAERRRGSPDEFAPTVCRRPSRPCEAVRARPRRARAGAPPRPPRRTPDGKGEAFAKATPFASRPSRLQQAVRAVAACSADCRAVLRVARPPLRARPRSEEHTSELQSLAYLVCRLLLEK